jgi:hypothetical protein
MRESNSLKMCSYFNVINCMLYFYCDSYRSCDWHGIGYTSTNASRGLQIYNDTLIDDHTNKSTIE